MSENNLVQNGEFSNGYQNWTLEGLVQNTQSVSEDGNFFARFGPGVTMYQDLVIEANRKHTLQFRLRAQWMGNGVTVKIQGMDADDQLGETLLEQSFGETTDWTTQELSLTASAYSKIRLSFTIPSAADLDDIALLADQPGLLGQYFNGRSFDSLVFERPDPNIDFAWPVGKPPSLGNRSLNRNDYSVRWTGLFVAPNTVKTGIVFVVDVDDGVRLWITPADSPERLILDSWTLSNVHTVTSTPVQMEAGQRFGFRLEFFNGPEPGVIRLKYCLQEDSPETAIIIPPENFFQLP